MKKVYIIAVFALCILSMNAQTSNNFSYKTTDSGMILISPVSDQSKSLGRRAVIQYDVKYFNDIIYKEVRNIFTDDDFRKVQILTFYSITISSSGSVLSCTFGIMPDDKDIFTDDKLYNLYLNLMKVKFDMSKTKTMETIDPNDLSYDYAQITGNILPPEYRKSSKVK
ncbi:MAG TPA: hypothetical protein VHO50_10535 [Bacteroidales bacterium]|nr:hypothetical protein [Bacteroidales bacterium]